jgi:hypothetical protein
VEVGIQRFFNFVSTHHEVIERVHYTSMKRDWTISEMQLQAECLEHCEENEIKFNFLLERLVEHRILSELDEGQYEVIKPFYQFLQWLLNERQLFDQGYIQTCVTRMQACQETISNQNMLDTVNLNAVKDNVRLDLKAIIEAMSDLNHFTERNREAIISASRMADEINSPETRRALYIEITRLFEEYVKPVRSMLKDSFVEVCENVARTVEIVQSRLFDDPIILERCKHILARIIGLRIKVREAHSDMWRVLESAMRDINQHKFLHNSCMLAQEMILKKGRKAFGDLIEQHLRICSIRPKGLFTDSALKSWWLGMENAEFISREFDIEFNENITPPKPPIQIETLLPRLRESENIEDLLAWVLDVLPNRSLEECFTVIFKIFDNVTKSEIGTIQLTPSSNQSYSRGSRELEFSKIKWSG